AVHACSAVFRTGDYLHRHPGLSSYAATGSMFIPMPMVNRIAYAYEREHDWHQRKAEVIEDL
ncbi:MAG: hypothetical protein OXG49_07785, partial [Chloroflexi bacterium]|nr:hypothetical protein [Chloroflexota bacterium]